MIVSVIQQLWYSCFPEAVICGSSKKDTHFWRGGGGEGVFLVLKWLYQFYTYFGSRVELVTKIPKSTPDTLSSFVQTFG